MFCIISMFEFIKVKFFMFEIYWNFFVNFYIDELKLILFFIVIEFMDCFGV